MEPLAIAGYLLLSTAAIEGILVGTLGGAIAWRIRAGLLWVLPLVAGGYLAGAAVLASYSPAAAAVFGLPPLVLTFLITWLTADYLRANAGLRPVWASLAAICCALIAGAAWGFLFRIDVWVPVACAMAADVCLILFVVFLTRRRKLLRQAG